MYMTKKKAQESSWTSTPEEAWVKHILPHTSNPGWIEESTKITEIGISKRELFTLIILAHVYNKDGGNWVVGYEPNDGLQNDGHITNGESKVIFEHKLVAKMEPKEVLSAILSTYKKTAKKRLFVWKESSVSYPT